MSAAAEDGARGEATAEIGAAAPGQDLERATESRSMVSAREAGRNRVAVATGFVVGGGIGATLSIPKRILGGGPTLKGGRMRNRKLNAQLAPAMLSLAATNQQLLGLVGSRHSPLWKLAGLGVAAAGIRYVTAEPEEREAMLEQAQALLSQGQAVLESTGVLDKLFK